MRYHYSHFN